MSQSSTPIPSAPTLLFLGTEEDRAYAARLKQMVGACSVYVVLTPISTIAEVLLYCKKRNITGVFSTSKILLHKLLGRDKSASLDNYAGSYFIHGGIEFVFINPLEHLIKVPYGAFLTRRYISKLTAPETWTEVPEFNWCMLTPTNAEAIFARYSTAYAIAVDIETFKSPLSIRCIGYTAIFIDGKSISTHSCVLPLDEMYAVAVMRKFNWKLKAPKIFQNGKYDISYLARYNAPIYNYLWDTANLFHCWYSELPKDLAFLGGFFIRKAMYWKDLANTNDLMEYYRYNALDTWTTCNVWCAQMLEMPGWANNNYVQEFPLVFPCHLSEMTGIKRDMKALAVAKTKLQQDILSKNLSMDRMLGVTNFNSNSYKQVRALLKILGCGDVTESDETALAKFSLRHPLNSRILGNILDIRGLRKLSSTYLRTDDDITKTSKGGAKEFNGRILYSLNPHGTDTGRLASVEHHFWCGLQIQNITRGESVKSTIVADEGFRFGEIDLSQAESRDTAYISGDKALIEALSSGRDFHSLNASAFFGVPYDDIYDDTKGKTKDKKLRDLAKRVNHGANYLMGPGVLIETMGEDKVWEAKRLLNLPRGWGLKEVAEYLLAQFHKTYPTLKSIFYPSVVAAVITHHMLVGATGWTRYCFGNPKDNKRDKNAYVAHVPQSLNAMVLNKAYMKVFYEIALHPVHKDNFKLCAQIHDSILCQVRIGHEYLYNMVRECMEIPITIKGCDGVVRTFTVPADIKAGPDGLGAKYWSEAE